MFWQYQKEYKNGERWVTKSKYDELQKNESTRNKAWRESSNGQRYYQKNRENISSRFKEWRKSNQHLLTKRQNQRRKESVLVSASCRASCLVRNAIKGRGYSKTSKTQEILGCTYISFVKHIQDQFLPGMSWENRSQWHIDHIIPMASAKSEEEVLKLNHYTNLRPLWAKDNLSKGSKISVGC